MTVARIIPEKLVVPACLALNAVSSIGIVFVNKLVFRDYGFPYGTLLTTIHFTVTFLLLCVCLGLGVFEFKRVSVVRMIPLCLSFCGFVALTNMSLVYNSVGFYQLMKVLTTPLLVVLQTLFYDQHFSNKVKVSLAVICVGVIIGTVTDAEANLYGTIIATSALLVTCQYQIWVGTKQKEYNCNSFQLLFYQAPISAIMLFPMAVFSDNLLTQFTWPCAETIWMILLSAVLAFLVNISIFLVIGKTSPVTYNVLGHFKLCVILSLGFIFFGAPVTAKNVSGILITLAGVFWYTQLKQRESEAKANQSRKDPLASNSHSSDAKKFVVEVADDEEGGASRTAPMKPAA